MSKISALTELAEAPASTDEFVIVDKSDTTMAATGTTKRVQSQYVTIADASTTVKGKVELLTDAETITGADTTRAMTASNLTAKMDTDGTLAGNSDTRIPSQKAVKTYADTKTTLATVLSTIASGWTSISATLTYSSADAPTYVCTTSSDMTGSIGVGMRIKLTHSASTKYFIVTAINASTITLYGGTDYTLAATAITAPYYSNVKAPLGFPLYPTKWTVKVTDASSRTQATPTQNTWYNLGSVTISVPIGAWNVDYQASGYFDDSTSTVLGDIWYTLSTGNNSETDKELSARNYMYVNSAVSGSGGCLFTRSKQLVLAAKTSYYLNEKTSQSGVAQIISGNDLTTCVIRAVCAYL